MDNVRMDGSYLVLSLSHNSKSLTLHQVKCKRKSHCFFSLTAMTARFGNFYITRMTSMLMEEPLLYLLVTNVITLGRLENQKCWNRLNDELKDLWVFAYHTPSMALRKKGERGQLNMHIIWGYIRSLGFKLLDERQLWINVIFSLTFGHLLRARKKVFVCAFTINNPYYRSVRCIVLLKHPKWLSNITDFRYLFRKVKLPLICVIQHTITKQYCYCHVLCPQFVMHEWMEKV